MPSSSSVGIHRFADLLDGRDQRRQPFERVVLALHGNEHAVRGDQRIHGEHVQRRRAVDEDDVEGFAHRAAARCSSFVSRPVIIVSRRTSAAVRSWFVGRMVKPPPSSVHERRLDVRLAQQHFAGAALELGLVDAAAHGRVALGIEIDEQRAALGGRQRGREIDGGRRFADAAFLVRNGDDALHRAVSVAHPAAHLLGGLAREAQPGGLSGLRGSRRSLRDETALGGVDPLLGELVGHDVRRAVLAAGALEDLGEARGDAVDLRRHLGFGAAAEVFARGADDAARVDDVVRRIQDAGGLQRGAVADPARAGCWRRPRRCARACSGWNAC